MYLSLSEYIQINRCSFHQSEELPLNVLYDEALLRLPLPAAQHHVIDLLRAQSWALQHLSLSDTFYYLKRRKGDKKSRRSMGKHSITAPRVASQWQLVC